MQPSQGPWPRTWRNAPSVPPSVRSTISTCLTPPPIPTRVDVTLIPSNSARFGVDRATGSRSVGCLPPSPIGPARRSPLLRQHHPFPSRRRSAASPGLACDAHEVGGQAGLRGARAARDQDAAAAQIAPANDRSIPSKDAALRSIRLAVATPPVEQRHAECPTGPGPVPARRHPRPRRQRPAA